MNKHSRNRGIIVQIRTRDCSRGGIPRHPSHTCRKSHQSHSFSSRSTSRFADSRMFRTRSGKFSKFSIPHFGELFDRASRCRRDSGSDPLASSCRRSLCRWHFCGRVYEPVASTTAKVSTTTGAYVWYGLYWESKGFQINQPSLGRG